MKRRDLIATLAGAAGAIVARSEELRTHFA
jgi:hypothetical protein